MVTDSKGNIGFPGFSGISAAQTLSYVAAMQEHGVPVTYAYISDAHDNHAHDIATAPAACSTDPELALGNANGPGSICYEAQLAAYNEAFGKFFSRLAADGIAAISITRGTARPWRAWPRSASPRVAPT